MKNIEISVPRVTAFLCLLFVSYDGRTLFASQQFPRHFKPRYVVAMATQIIKLPTVHFWPLIWNSWSSPKQWSFCLCIMSFKAYLANLFCCICFYYLIQHSFYDTYICINLVPYSLNHYLISCLSSTLVVMSHESNAFSMSSSFEFSWSLAHGLMHTWVAQRHVFYANTEHALLSCDVITKVVARHYIFWNHL